MADDGIYPSPEEMTATNAELVGLVRRQLPMRFYSGEEWWTVYCAASLARMADTVESLVELLPARHDLDAQTLLRSLYEQVVTLAWIAVDPVDRHRRWEGEANVQLVKLHNDALTFGEVILTSQELAIAQASRGLPPVTEMALKADEHWSSRIDGLHPDGHLLGFRGLYVSIYRLGSRPAHGALLALEPYVTRGDRVVVDVASRDTLLWYALAAPLFCIALLVAAQRFPWLDEATVRELADRAVASASLSEDNQVDR